MVQRQQEQQQKQQQQQQHTQRHSDVLVTKQPAHFLHVGLLLYVAVAVALLLYPIRQATAPVSVVCSTCRRSAVLHLRLQAAVGLVVARSAEVKYARQDEDCPYQRGAEDERDPMLDVE